MKLFTLIMLRCALIMLLSSLLQNGTLATLGEWEKSCQELKEWAASCHQVVDISIPHELRTSLTTSGPGHLTQMYRAINTFELMLERVNKFPIEGMDQLLKRRLQQPLENAISNCKKLDEKVKQSGLEKDKEYLETLLSKIRSIAERIGEELNTFIFEVKLELIKKANWTSGNMKQLANKFLNLCAPKKRSYYNMPWLRLELAQQIKSYCNHKSLEHAILWILGDQQEGPRYEPGTPEFNEYLGTLILNANLEILETELLAKIGVFAQQPPHIDGDGFVAFSHTFKLEWNQFDQKIGQFTRMDDKDAFRKRLDNLAEKAMEETAPLKAIISEKLDQLVTKCQNSSGKFNKEETSNQLVVSSLLKNAIKHFLGGSNKSKEKKQKEKEKKEEAKKKEIDAMKEIINGIGMFDAAAYKLLVRFEHEEFGNTDFCAELEKAVKEDKKMVSNAYQVKNVDE